MPSKSVLKRGFPASAERMSESYRSKLGLTKFDPLDAFSLAGYLDVPLVAIDEFEYDLSNDFFKTLRDNSKFYAMWMPNEQGDKIIIYNNHHSEKRQQSDIMHELSHIILKHEIPQESAQLCLSLGLHYYNTLHEQEAKYLSGCLKITRPGLQWALKNGFSEDQISDYFNASLDMVKYRLNITGVLIQRKYQTSYNP